MRLSFDLLFLAVTVITTVVAALPLDSNGGIGSGKVIKTWELSPRSTGLTPVSALNDSALELPFDTVQRGPPDFPAPTDTLESVIASTAGIMFTAGVLVGAPDGESVAQFTDGVQSFANISDFFIQTMQASVLTLDLDSIEQGIGGSGPNKRDSSTCLQMANTLLSSVTQFIQTCQDLISSLGKEEGEGSMNADIFPLCDCDSVDSCVCNSNGVNTTVESSTLLALQDILLTQAVEILNDTASATEDSIINFVQERNLILENAQSLVDACT